MRTFNVTIRRETIETVTMYNIVLPVGDDKGFAYSDAEDLAMEKLCATDYDLTKDESYLCETTDEVTDIEEEEIDE